MKKNTRKNKNAVAAKHDGPGRPKYTPVFPRGKEWTFTDLMEANGVEANLNSKNFGKGPKCTMLTLRKFLARDAKKMGRSLIVKVKGVTSEPNSKSGLGRRAYLYSLRTNAGVKKVKASEAPEAVSANDTVPVARDEVSESTKKYEEIKNILTAPEAPEAPEAIPASLTVPAVTIAPETTPAPETVVSETNGVKAESEGLVAPETVPATTEPQVA